MLQNIGDTLKSRKWLSYSFLAVIALLFTVWGAYGIVDLTTIDQDVAATVDGERIPRSEVSQAWQRALPQYLSLYGNNLGDQQRAALQDELLDSYIERAALLARSRKLGFRVTDEQVKAAYRAEPAFQVDGQFSASAAAAALASAGITPAQYDADSRRRLLINQLGTALGATEFVTQSEGARLFALQMEERELRYLLLPADRFASGPAFDDAAIQAEYESDPASWTVPESARLAYAELTLANVASQVSVSEEQVRELFEAEKDRFQEPERRHARHILITVEAGQDDAAARARAEDLANRARAPGADFAALARENSQDLGSSSQGGDLGWTDRTTLEAPFADALFAMGEGEVSAPVRTRFGWHVIRLDGIQAGRSRTFEEVREELESELRAQLAADEFGNRQEQLQERIERGAADLAPLVEAFGLERGEIEDFVRGEGGLPLGSDAELNEEVFSERVAREGNVGGPVALGDDRLVVFEVLEHRPAKLRPLAEVRDQVVASLTRKRGREQALKAAQEALAKVESGEDLAKVATGLKLTVEAAQFVGRGEPAVPVQVVRAAFEAPRPAPGKPHRQAVATDDGAAVFEVTATRVPEGEVAQFIREQVAQREIQRRGSVVVDAYLAELIRKADIEKNPQAFQ